MLRPHFFTLAFYTLFSLLFLTACNDAELTSHHSLSHIDRKSTIAIYSMDNYTDTPHAGMRAANIAEGILLSKGYRVRSKINITARPMTFSEKLANARRAGVRYMLTGGISEWRYKTGIDGEPAVSLHLKLIDIAQGRIVWSATGSDSSWGNTSVGVVAQALISRMLSVNPE